MTFESILYSIGFGFGTVLVLFMAAGIGWIVREEVGALVGSGIVTMTLSFGATLHEGGSTVAAREAAISAGASILASAVVFVALYSVAQGMRAEAAGQPRLVVTSGALALIAGSAAASIAGSLLLAGHSMWNDHVGSLAVYALLFGGLASAASEWEKKKSGSGKEQSAAADASDH